MDQGGFYHRLLPQDCRSKKKFTSGSRTPGLGAGDKESSVKRLTGNSTTAVAAIG